MYSVKHMELLNFVKNNGQVDVEMGPRDVKQNKNFYNRTFRLESEGLFTIQRRDGAKSIFSLTPLGLKVTKGNCK